MAAESGAADCENDARPPYPAQASRGQRPVSYTQILWRFFLEDVVMEYPLRNSRWPGFSEDGLLFLLKPRYGERGPPMRIQPYAPRIHAYGKFS